MYMWGTYYIYYDFEIEAFTRRQNQIETHLSIIDIIHGVHTNNIIRRMFVIAADDESERVIRDDEYKDTCCAGFANVSRTQPQHIGIRNVDETLSRHYHSNYLSGKNNYSAQGNI